MWKIFGKSPALPRCKDFAWRACCSLLFVRNSLWRRGVDVDPMCPLCGVVNGTVTHLWLACSLSWSFWVAHSLALRLDHFSSLPEFLSQFMGGVDIDEVAQWQTTSYALWEARNKQIFQGRNFDWKEALRWASMLVVVASSTSALCQSPPVQSACWHRPLRFNHIDQHITRIKPSWAKI